MTRIIVKKLILDLDNLFHISRHNVTREEVVGAGKRLAYHRETYNKRYLAVGRSGTKIITLILNRISMGKYYLVSARDASKKERKKVYEKERKG